MLSLDHALVRVSLDYAAHRNRAPFLSLSLIIRARQEMEHTLDCIPSFPRRFIFTPPHQPWTNDSALHPAQRLCFFFSEQRSLNRKWFFFSHLSAPSLFSDMAPRSCDRSFVLSLSFKWFLSKHYIDNPLLSGVFFLWIPHHLISSLILPRVRLRLET